MNPTNAPAAVITLGEGANGRELDLGGRLVHLSLKESRGDEADQLDIEIDDSDGRMAIPTKGQKLSLRLGWVGRPLIDKGDYTVDEIEHSGTPDTLRISARSADMKSSLRERREASHHGQSLGQIVDAVATRHKLTPRVSPELASIAIGHIDQTHESDLNFLTRLARRYDATATVKKGHLIVQRINSATTATGKPLQAIHITRQLGDRHRWHAAERDAYTGVKAEWQDSKGAKKRAAVTGTDDKQKKLRDIYATEADAMAAAKSEMQRIERGAATFELTLAIARPEIAPQSPCSVSGWGKPQIDGARWLVKTCTHSMDGGQGFTTAIELETEGSDKEAKAAD